MVDTEGWNTLSSMTQDSGLQYGLRQKTVLKRLREGYLFRWSESKSKTFTSKQFAQCMWIEIYLPLKFNCKHLTQTILCMPK